MKLTKKSSSKLINTSKGSKSIKDLKNKEKSYSVSMRNKNSKSLI